MFFTPNKIAFPHLLNAAIAQAIFRREEPETGDIAAIRPHLELLWQELAKQRGQRPASEPRGKGHGAQHYSENAQRVKAYAAYYLVANVLKLPLLLMEARQFQLSIASTPTNASGKIWLDIGSGPGTAALGLALWQRSFSGIAQVISLDSSREFLDWGQKILGAFQAEIAKLDPASRPFSASWSPMKADAAIQKSLQAIREHNPDVVLFSNSIAEICVDPEARGKFLEQIVASLTRAAQADGRSRWLLLIEPGSKDSSRELLSWRATAESRHKNLKIRLPCLDQRACGALVDAEDWCHEDIAVEFPDWFAELSASVNMRKTALLFSYQLFEITAASPEENSLPAGGARMVSQRLERKGFSECRLCTPQGKLKARSTHSLREREGRTTDSGIPDRGSVAKKYSLDEKGELRGWVDEFNSAKREDCDADMRRLLS